MKFWPFTRKANEDGSVSTSADLFRLLSSFGFSTASGATVNHKTALEVTTVLAVARVLSEGVAQVPLKLFKTVGAGSEPATDHPLYNVLYRRPNPWQTSFEFRETMMLHAVLTGDAVSFINRLGGVVRELIPILPGACTVEQDANYAVWYKVKGKDGSTQTIPASAIWHVRGPSWDGLSGLDITKHAREAISLAMMSERAHAKLHANGMQVSGTYSVDAVLSEKQQNDLRDWLVKEFSGTENSNKPIILDRGAKFASRTMTGVDAQHLETRKYQVEEICRAARVNPIMIGAESKNTTYASAEQMFLAHVIHTMMPWYVRIEQSIEVNLLTEAEVRNGYFAKFNASALLRGSHKERAEYFARALGSGGAPAWMTQDEIRALEELNPMGGDAAKLPIQTNTAKIAAKPTDTVE